MKNIDPFKKIPNRIGELIEESNKTLKQISQETGINYETLSAYKRQVRTPKRDNATILSDYFNVSIPYLMGVDDNRKLINPSKESLLEAFIKKAKGESNLDKLTSWTPFNDYVPGFMAVLKSETVDSISKILLNDNYPPEFVKYFKQKLSKLSDEIPYDFNTSSTSNSPYHYLWEAWINTDEYKQAIKKK